MPNYDLETVITARVANLEASELRIANQTVWTSGGPEATMMRELWTPGNHNSPGPYSFGWSLVLSASVYIPAVWWYQPSAGNTADVYGSIYSSTGTLLVEKLLASANIVKGQWNRIEFDTPYFCDSANQYRPSIFAEAGGEQGYDSTAFSRPWTTGPCTVSTDYWRYGHLWPNNNSGAETHGIDFEFYLA